MTTQETLLAEIEAFLIERGMRATNFGIAAMNDRAFVFRLRSGKTLYSTTIDKVRAYMQRERARPLAQKRRRAESSAAA